MTKANTPTEMSKGQSDNINNATKKFDYTAVADRLRTVSWSNYSQPTGVVYRYDSLNVLLLCTWCIASAKVARYHLLSL